MQVDVYRACVYAYGAVEMRKSIDWIHSWQFCECGDDERGKESSSHIERKLKGAGLGVKNVGNNSFFYL